MDKTVGGLDENVGGALAYALGWITGGALLILEPSNKFVRFHAWQSLIVFGGLSIAWFIAMASIVFWFVAFVVIPPLSAVLWLLLMYKAYHGERYQLPFAGDLAAHRD